MSYLDMAHKVGSEEGYEFSDDEINEIVGYVNRKIGVIGKDLSYFDLLFEEELRHYLLSQKMIELALVCRAKKEW